MLKNILNLKGAQLLNKAEQKDIRGGGGRFCGEWCPDGSCLCWLSHPHETCPFAEAC